MASSAPSGTKAPGLLPTRNSGWQRGPPGKTRPLRCTAVLRAEHAVVARLLNCLERAAAAIFLGGPVHEGAFVRVFGLMNVFVCRGHFAKEGLLLEMLEGKGLWQLPGFPGEHRDSLEFAAAMLRALPEAAGGTRPARRMLAENATAYVGFMRSHIAREERLVFSEADSVLTDLDDAAAVEAFAEIDCRTGCTSGEALAEDVERCLAGILGRGADGAPRMYLWRPAEE